ncbi:unnamed protein product [Clonostachys rhizophaga]|uniref:Uncharacterized protein n=1 Tax=Clonostachys rhizophaga TaxID=160324 RepID=A0A9N9VPP9_9HYPO|nr:unnamed protein product [Clonostachys rhizophaga]
MGSLIPDSLVKAHLGSKRHSPDLEDGVDEPASKRSRSSVITDENEHGKESLETIATAYTQAPEPDSTDHLTHDGQGSTSSVPSAPDRLGNDADDTVSEKSAAPDSTPEKSIDSVVDTDAPKASPSGQPTLSSQDPALSIPDPTAVPGNGVDDAATFKPAVSGSIPEASADNASNNLVGLASKIDPAASTTSLPIGVEDAQCGAYIFSKPLDKPWDYDSINGCECGEMLYDWWGDLRAFVRRFVYNTLPSVYSWDRLPGVWQDEISEWATNAPNHFNSSNKNVVENIFIAWIFRILYERVFSGADPDKWNGELWQSFGKIQASARELVTDSDDKYNPLYHHWRNLTARVVHRQNPEQRHFDTCWLRSQIEKRVLSIQTEYLETNPHPELDMTVLEFLDGSYMTLIDAVMRMDMVMIVTRWHIRMEMSHPDTGQVHGFRPEENRMDITVTELGAEPGLVDYVMVPALVVHGWTTGGFPQAGTESVIYPLGYDYWYKAHMYSTPMEVVCPEKLEERGQN